MLDKKLGSFRPRCTPCGACAYQSPCSSTMHTSTKLHRAVSGSCVARLHPTDPHTFRPVHRSQKSLTQRMCARVCVRCVWDQLRGQTSSACAMAGSGDSAAWSGQALARGDRRPVDVVVRILEFERDMEWEDWKGEKHSLRDEWAWDGRAGVISCIGHRLVAQVSTRLLGRRLDVGNRWRKEEGGGKERRPASRGGSPVLASRPCTLYHPSSKLSEGVGGCADGGQFGGGAGARCSSEWPVEVDSQHA